MSIEQYIKSSQSTLGDYFLSEHKKFRIPLNQRPWSWKASDLEGFWNDLLKVSERCYHITGTDQNKWKKKTGAEPAPYFIGAIVAMKQDDELELVDGQQRITAVTMIIAAFLEELLEIQTNYTGARRGATAIQSAVRQVTSWLETSDGNPKLNVDEQFQDLFYAYISKPVTKELKAQALEALELDFASMPHHKKLMNCYDSIRDTINAFLRDIAEANRIKAINALLDVLSSYDFPAKQDGSYPPSAINKKGIPRKHFGDSTMHLVKELADKTKYPAWNFEVIEERQKALAQYALKVWTLRMDEF